MVDVSWCNYRETFESERNDNQYRDISGRAQLECLVLTNEEQEALQKIQYYKTFNKTAQLTKKQQYANASKISGRRRCFLIRNL